MQPGVGLNGADRGPVELPGQGDSTLTQVGCNCARPGLDVDMGVASIPHQVPPLLWAHSVSSQAGKTSKWLLGRNGNRDPAMPAVVVVLKTAPGLTVDGNYILSEYE